MVVAYMGTSYGGWQRQKEVTSVQSQLEQALTKIANQSISVWVSGRTDRGVHATAQVIHFDYDGLRRPQSAWVRGTNSHLPADIKVLNAIEVDSSFHARFSATLRTYRYHIWSQSVMAPWAREGWTHHPYPLDIDAMHVAGQLCLGEHDFSSFRASGCQAKTPHRRIDVLNVKPSEHGLIMTISGNAFLHHMVRNIMGTLLMIGQGERSVDWMSTVLFAKDRCQAGPTASAAGLWLVGIRYDHVYDKLSQRIDPYRDQMIREIG